MMFPLDTVYNIVFLATACALPAVFLLAAVLSCVLHKKKMRFFGVLWSIVNAVLWLALLLLTAAFILYKLEIVAIDGNTLVLWGLSVPELGRVVAMCNYTVTQILLGAAVVLSTLAFILQVTRREHKVLSAYEMDMLNGQVSEEPPQEEEPEVVEEEVSQEEELEVAEEETPQAEEPEVVEEEVSQEEELEVVEEEVPQEKEPEIIEKEAPQEEEPEVIEEEVPQDDEPEVVEKEVSQAEEAKALDLEMPTYVPKENVYRSVVGEINSVLDTVMSGEAIETQPSEVKPEVVRIRRERSVENAREIEGEEIAVLSRHTTVPVRTVTRNAPVIKPTPERETATKVQPATSKKPRVTKTSPVKPQPPEKPKPEHKAVEPTESLITRRHVVINRSNVVNMFSDYLKNRTEEEKERLEGSISTIILK